MKSNFLSPKFIFVSVAILIAALSRLLPHLPNFTPVAAIALFGGAFLPDRKSAFIIPFAAMFLSDLFLGLSASTVPVYFCLAFTVILGLIIKNKITICSAKTALPALRLRRQHEAAPNATSSTIIMYMMVIYVDD